MLGKTIMIAAVIATSAIMQNGTADAAYSQHWHHHASAMHAGSWARHRHLARAMHRHTVFRSRRFRVGAVRGTYAPVVWTRPSAGFGGTQVGRASFYAGGGHTANGGLVGSATCAHRSLPFGTKVLVTNMSNARQAVLTVNDRGPFVRGRLLDVSRGAAGMLGMLHAGVSQIRMQVLGGAG